MPKLFKFDAVNGFQIFVVLRFSFAILTSIAMAKSGITLSEIGIYEALMLVGASFTFFWMTGLLHGVLSVYPNLSEEEKPKLIFNIFTLFAVLSVTVTFLMWLFSQSITAGMTNFEYLPHFHWLCIWLAINLPTFLVEYIYILQNRPKWMVIFGVYSFLGQFLVVVIPLFLGWSLEISFIGLVILAATKFVWLLFILKNNSTINWSFQRLQPYWLIALPIVLYTLIGGVMNYVDGVIIMKYYDEEQFAIYRNGAREFPIALALLNAMSAALIPNISEHLASGLGQIKHRTRNLMYPLFGASVVLMFVSEWAYPIVFSADFSDSAYVFNVYLLALISRILLPQTILIGLKKTKTILTASVLEISLNLGLSLLFIQEFGLVGVAMATVIAFSIEKVFLILYNHYRLHIPLKDYLDVPRFVVCSFLLLASYCGVFFFL